MGKQPSSFPLYVQEFLGGCTYLTAEETGAYIRLLCHEWEQGYLPDDDSKLRKLAGCGRNAMASIRHKFYSEKPGILLNKKLEEIRQVKKEISEKQKANSLIRWRGSGATAIPPQSHGNAKQDASYTYNTISTIVDNKEYKESCYSFTQFWSDYDWKVNMDKCQKLYDKISEENRMKIKDYIPLYKNAQPNKQYRKRPETFLRNKSWYDELPMTSQQILPLNDPTDHYDANGKLRTIV